MSDYIYHIEISYKFPYKVSLYSDIPTVCHTDSHMPECSNFAPYCVQSDENLSLSSRGTQQ